MEERPKCVSCKKPLIAFQGNYLHTETPCNGILDCIEIEATVSDKFLHDKFKKMYGTPSIDDSERITNLESNIKELSVSLEEKETLLNHPVIKFLLRLLRKI